MKKQVLTIDQMKRLKGLGIDTSIASMYWTYPVEPERITRLTPVVEYALKNVIQHAYIIVEVRAPVRQ